MKNIFTIFIFAFCFVGNALAKFTYEGHLTDLSNNPLSNLSTLIKVGVVGLASSCVLFLEEHSVLTDSKGFFSIQVGSGTDIDGLASTLDGVFSNVSIMSGMAACSYSPTASDGRRLKIDVNSGTGYEALGFVTLGKSPQAAHADSIGGFEATNLVRASIAAPLLSSADVTSLTSLIAGTSSLYAVAGISGTVTSVSGISPIAVSSGTTTPNITISQASASSSGFLTSADWTIFNSKFGSTSAVTGDLSGTLGSPIVAKIRGQPVSATAPASGDYLRYNGSQYVPTAVVAAPVTSVAGRTGMIQISSSDVSGLGTAAYKNIGTTAGTVAAGDDSRLVNGLTTSLPTGQSFLGNGGNLAVARNIHLADIRSSVAPVNPAFNISGGCSAGNMITYSSVTDDFTCAAFSITSGQVTSALGTGGPILMPLGSTTNPSYSFSGDATTGMYSPGNGYVSFSISSVEQMRISSIGVGIGTASPDSKLSVVGTLRATSISGSHYDNTAGATFDLEQGNLITSSYNCATNITLNNFRNGGVYRIVIKDPGTSQCSFNTGVGGFDAGTVTYKFNPANAARNATSDTAYELSRFGNTVYVKWLTF